MWNNGLVDQFLGVLGHHVACFRGPSRDKSKYGGRFCCN